MCSFIPKSIRSVPDKALEHECAETDEFPVTVNMEKHCAQSGHAGVTDHMSQMEKVEDRCHKAIALHRGLSWAFAIVDQSKLHSSSVF